MFCKANDEATWSMNSMEWPFSALGMWVMQHCTTWLPWLLRMQATTWPFSAVAISTFDTMVGRTCTAGQNLRKDFVPAVASDAACCSGAVQALTPTRAKWMINQHHQVESIVQGLWSTDTENGFPDQHVICSTTHQTAVRWDPGAQQ